MWDLRPQFDLEAVSVSFLKTFHSGAAQQRNETGRADLNLLPPSRIFVAKNDRPIAFDIGSIPVHGGEKGTNLTEVLLLRRLVELR